MTTLELLIQSTIKRAEMGKARYECYLTARNGRNALVDAFQEALDQLVYLRQAMEDEGTMPFIDAEYAVRPEPAPMNQPDLTPIYQMVIGDLQQMADQQGQPTYFVSNLHYIYHSAIHVALRLQFEINRRILAQQG